MTSAYSFILISETDTMTLVYPPPSQDGHGFATIYNKPLG